jgi:hypothetical protein
MGHDDQNGSGLLCRISVAAAWGGDGGGLARPAVARSGIDECCGQDFGAAQGVVTAARGLPSGGGIRCEQMSLAGTDVYYFHRSSWWHHLVSARLAVFAHCGVSAFYWVQWNPTTTGIPLAGETNGRQPVVAGNISGAGPPGAGSGERSIGGLSPA